MLFIIWLLLIHKMTSKFNGFTQDDINQLRRDGINGKPTTKTAGTSKPKPAAFVGRSTGGITRKLDAKTETKTSSSIKSQHFQRNKTPPLNIANQEIKKNTNVSLAEVNMDESMSTSIEEALFYKPRSRKTSSSKNTKAESQEINEEVHDKYVEVNDDNFNDSSILPNPIVQNESPFKGISLKDFESHRKIVEEQNKQKKEMLYKAIEQHSQKTASEAKKIEDIKYELAKLDNDLAIDVAILREQIEIACANYSNIEKQYNRIESQFLKVKLDLHNACEKKELLTEHLCTVISHNEDRKAKKLSDLMEKVGISPTGELNLFSSINSNDSTDK